MSTQGGVAATKGKGLWTRKKFESHIIKATPGTKRYDPSEQFNFIKHDPRGKAGKAVLGGAAARYKKPENQRWIFYIPGAVAGQYEDIAQLQTNAEFVQTVGQYTQTVISGPYAGSPSIVDIGNFQTHPMYLAAIATRGERLNTNYPIEDIILADAYINNRLQNIVFERDLASTHGVFTGVGLAELRGGGGTRGEDFLTKFSRLRNSGAGIGSIHEVIDVSKVAYKQAKGRENELGNAKSVKSDKAGNKLIGMGLLQGTPTTRSRGTYRERYASSLPWLIASSEGDGPSNYAVAVNYLAANGYISAAEAAQAISEFSRGGAGGLGLQVGNMVLGRVGQAQAANVLGLFGTSSGAVFSGPTAATAAVTAGGRATDAGAFAATASENVIPVQETGFQGQTSGLFPSVAPGPVMGGTTGLVRQPSPTRIDQVPLSSQTLSGLSPRSRALQGQSVSLPSGVGAGFQGGFGQQGTLSGQQFQDGFGQQGTLSGQQGFQGGATSPGTLARLQAEQAAAINRASLGDL